MTKSLTAKQVRLGVVDLIQQNPDPSAGGGVAALIGSVYLRDGVGQLWQKTGAAATAWSQLAASFAWYSVRAYGAVGNGATDDTAAFQAAITDCNAHGGGVVYVPPGNYLLTQIAFTDTFGVQLLGAGGGSKLTWTWNAAGAAGSMITLSAGALRSKISYLQIDGSGLTNPSAGRGNHLIQVGTGVGGGVVETQILHCEIGNMVAASGDAVHILGSAGNVVSRTWVAECTIDGASRYGVAIRQGSEYVWVVENYISGGDTEVAMVTTADVAINAVLISANEIKHTSATVAQALRLEGGATTLASHVIATDNVMLGGFATSENLKYAVHRGNVITSGAFAIADSVWRIFGAVTDLAFSANVIERDAAATAGPCVSAEAAGGAAPVQVGIRSNILIADTPGAPFVRSVDCSRVSIGANLCRGADATASAVFAIDVQAVTVAISAILVGPGNQVTAAAGSYKAMARFLANGSNITTYSFVGNQGDNCDYALQFEAASGGVLSGELYAGNNINSTVGDHNDVGVTVRPRIGLNAGVFGAQLFEGAGNPNGNVTAQIGSMYLRGDGGTGSAVYYKETGTGTGGWIGIAPGVLVFGAGDMTTATSAVYLAPGYAPTALATPVGQVMTRPATLRNLYVNVGVAGTGIATNVYTVQKNGVDTTITASIANTSAALITDTTHTATAVAGDVIEINCVKTGSPSAGQTFVTGSLEAA